MYRDLFQGSPRIIVLTSISLIPLPWSLFNQTHDVCGGQNYGSPKCPSSSPQNTCIVPYMVKELKKCHSGDEPWDRERTQDFQGGLCLITWAHKQRIFFIKRQSRTWLEEREEKWGVRVSVNSCCCLWRRRKGTRSQGMQMTSST